VSFVEILAPGSGNTALGAGNLLSGFTAGDDSIAATAPTVSTAGVDQVEHAQEFRLAVKLADGTTATSADIVLAGNYTADTLLQFVGKLNTAILGSTLTGKVEAYVDGTGIGFRTTSLGCQSYVAIAAPGTGNSALGAGNLLSGYTAGDSSTTTGTIGTDAIAYLDNYSNTISYIEGDAAETMTTATLLDAATGGGSLKIQVSNTGLVIGNAIINVAAATGKAKLYDGAAGTGTAGAKVNWTAEQAFIAEDSAGKTLRVTIGNCIQLDGNGAGTATDDLTIQDNSLSFQVGGERLQTVSLSLPNVAGDQLALGITNTSGFADLGAIRGSNAQQCADALLLIDEAISEISSVRAEIGSFQLNTLDSQINNLRIASENLTAARSTVVDTNFAQTVSEFTKQQILMQAGISVLASAGQMPQMVLKLLQG